MFYIGMLHHRKDPSKVRKAYACAAVAKMEGVHFFYFTFEDIDLQNKKVRGKVYENGIWKINWFPYPDAIINSSSPKTKIERKIYRQLKKVIPFTSYSIGNKYNVYQRMLESGKFGDVIIPTHEVYKEIEVLKYLHTYGKIVMKPKKGRQGKEVIYLENKSHNKILWTEEGERREFNLEVFTEAIKTRLRRHSQIVQPFIHSRTKSGNPFDVRIHVQKNGEGKWIVNSIYPRVGNKNGIVSNIHSGGYRAELMEFLLEEFPATHSKILNKLEKLASQFPLEFEQLYNYSFDELGIDVGLEDGSQLKVFEVNWRPGTKFRELDNARYLIQYAIYLASSKIN